MQTARLPTTGALAELWRGSKAQPPPWHCPLLGGKSRPNSVGSGRSGRRCLTPSLFLQLKMILIKCCDISNEVRPMEVAEPWVDCLLEEYFMQVRVFYGNISCTALRPPVALLGPLREAQFESWQVGHRGHRRVGRSSSAPRKPSQ